MSASAFERLGLVAVLFTLTACGEPAQYRFGTNVTGLRFAPVDLTEGVHPSLAVMRDPQNPFLQTTKWLTVQPDGGVGTKWQMLAGPGGVPAFYAFATALVQEPTGENQFYTAQMLGEIAQSGAFDESVTEAQVRQLAIDAYRATLDSFPGSVSYFADGKSFFSLDALAYQGAIRLGGSLPGYALVESTDGGQPVVVRTTAYVSADGGR